MVATVRHPTPWVPGPTLAVVLVLGCGSEPSAHAPDATGTTEATSTTSDGTTTLASTSGSASTSDDDDDTPADSTTGEPGPTEWVGTFEPTNFYGLFQPCGETQVYLTQGPLPTTDYPTSPCTFGFGPTSFHLRLLAIERPPPPEFDRPLLEVLQVLEGPCLVPSCDPRRLPSQCGTWTDFCDDAGFDCDFFAQDCPPGDKCMPRAAYGGTEWNESRCSPVADMPGQRGDPCTVEGSPYSGFDDCDFGHMCWNVDPESLQGTCVEMCYGDPSEPLCTDPDTSCAIAFDEYIVLCLPPCDPGMDLCYAGESCTSTQGGFFCLPDAPGA